MYKNFIEKVDFVLVEKLENNYREFISKLWEVLKINGKALIIFPLFCFENPLKLKIHPQDFVKELIKYFAVINIYFRKRKDCFYLIFHLEKI